MASVLGDTTCTIHPDRQATARCPSCRGFFCAECITEHEGKLTCATCLGVRRERSRSRGEKRDIPVLPVFQLLVGILICWALFYFFAQTLADMPDDFHDGTIWE